jgi:hypothetical protein
LKIKKLIPLIAAMIVMTAFFMPVYALASEMGEVPQMEEVTHIEEILQEICESVDIVIIIDYLEIEIPDIFSIPGMPDLSELPDLFGLPTAPPIPITPRPFTPDGQATIVDMATDGDGKRFYTFTTPAGNVFFLVVDLQRETDNVYFLNAVTEFDLLALAEEGDGTGNFTVSGIPTMPTEPDPDEYEYAENGEVDDIPLAQVGGNTGTIIFVVIGVLGIGGAGYYIKILRPKQQANFDDDEDYALGEGDDGEEMQFEDEPDEYSDDEDREDFDEEDR